MTKSKQRSLQQPRQKQKQAVQPKSEAPVTSNLAPPGPDIMLTPKHSKEHHYCKPNDTPWWRHLLEIAAFMIGAYAVVIYKGQWDEAHTANGLSAENFRAGQRAWVGVDGFGVTPLAPNSKPRVTIGIKNFGQTVALSTKYEMQPIFIEDIEHPRQYPGITALNMIRPKQESLDLGWQEHTMPQGKIEAHSREIGPALTATQYDELMNRQAWLFAYGRITYVDIFGESHLTTFCAYLDLSAGPSAFADCGGLSSMK